MRRNDISSRTRMNLTALLQSFSLLSVAVFVASLKQDMILRRFLPSKTFSSRYNHPTENFLRTSARALCATKKGKFSSGDWEANKDGSTLVIVESPSKAKTIQKFVDPEKFVVDSCAGHVRDLPKTGSDFAGKSELRKVMVNKELKLNVGDLGVDVMNNFEPIYVPMEGKMDILKRLQKHCEHCSRILLATDEDREGEAISWHLLETLKPKVPVKRAVFHEITKPAILESFENPRDIDMNLVESQETRRILDRLAGFTISPVLWRYVAPGLSAGRVQSCGLHLIAQRERKRWEFSESQYFSIKGQFSPADPSKAERDLSHQSRTLLARLHTLDGRRIAGEGDFDGATGELRAAASGTGATGKGKGGKGGKGKSKKSSELDAAGSEVEVEMDVEGQQGVPLVLDKDSAEGVVNWLSGRASGRTPNFKVTNIETKKSSRKPPPPFITSTLQQECSRKLGMSPSRCMSIAQELYEEGYITYMRTDSPALSATATGIARKLVTSIFGDDFLGASAPTAAVSTSKSRSSSAEDGEDASDKGGKKKGKKDDNSAGETATGPSANVPKNAQLAHEAIRPAEVDGSFRTPEQTRLDGPKRLLYSIIYRRTLASVMVPSQALTKTYIIEAEAAGTPTVACVDDDKKTTEYKQAVFRASETVTTVKGYLAAMEMTDSGRSRLSTEDPLANLMDLSADQQLWLTDRSGSDDEAARKFALADTEMNRDERSDVSLDVGGSVVDAERDAGGVMADDVDAADVAAAGEGQDAAAALSVGGLLATQHVTRPPLRFSEASFIKELETIGVGRPSTYSKIFQILKEREYIHVDKQTLIPTLRGLVVAEWLEKHFPDLVEPQFTASMEDALDKIARGEKDKLEFLKTFYLGDHQHTSDTASSDDHLNEHGHGHDSEHAQGGHSKHTGLLSKVVQKLERQEIDHKESRTLEIPFLKDIGVVQLSRSGAFIESKASMDASDQQQQEQEHSQENNDHSNSNNGDDDGDLESKRAHRWKLPEAMQIDIREITREAISFLMATEANMNGHNLGEDPETGRPVTLRSGRFGKYLQVGLDSEKNRTTHSVPQWLQLSSGSLSDIFEFAKLPKQVGVHPELQLPVIAEVSAKELCLGVEGYPLRVPLPQGMLISQIDDEIITALLSDTKAILDSQRGLGDWNGEPVFIRKGRFGYYIRSGKIIAGLRKLDPATVTLEDAIGLLESRGKEMGSGGKNKKKKGAAKGKKATTKKDNKSTVRKKSGYQVYCAEVMKTGMKMAEAAANWKLLDEAAQQSYKEKADALALEAAAASASAASDDDSNSDVEKKKKPSTKKAAAKTTSKSKDVKKAVVTSSNNSNSGDDKEEEGREKPRSQTGYQLYCSEVMKNGVKMKEAAAGWKQLDENAQQVYKDKAKLASV